MTRALMNNYSNNNKRLRLQFDIEVDRAQHSTDRRREKRWKESGRRSRDKAENKFKVTLQQQIAVVRFTLKRTKKERRERQL